MDTGTALGPWLRQRRLSLDLTQDELARQAGCSAEMIGKVETGTRRPSRQVAELLASALELSPEERPLFVRWARRLPETVEGAAGQVTAASGTASMSGSDNGASRIAGPSQEPPTSPVEGTNPYKGLRAFQEADAPLFFGREALSQRLVERLFEEAEMARFLAVVGPSGSGKSSVVKAGLTPALRRQKLPGGIEPLLVEFAPGAHPFEELEASLLRVSVNPPASLMEQLRDDERGLAGAVKRVLPADERTQMLLVIDQFEELFTLMRDEAARADFLDSLFAAVVEPRSRLWVVTTMRADFYDRPLSYAPSGELMSRRTEVTVPLSPSEMYRAITGPAERAGLALEADLAATIIQDVGEQPGTLPLLQYALTELYERREGRLLTLRAYAASGGVMGALARRAENLFAKLTGIQQEEARQLFLRLVSLGTGELNWRSQEGATDDTRRRVLMAELASAARDEGALQHVLDLYGRYRMLTFDRDPLGGGPTVEVAHEALLRSWGRLRDWLNESRERLHVQRRLMSSAAEWQALGLEKSFLASGARLSQFEELTEEADAPGALALTAEEQSYLAASLAEQNRVEATEKERQARELSLQKRAASQLRYLVAGLAIFLLVAAGLAVWALNRSQVAEANLAHADALRLASEANNLLLAQGDTQLIGLLSIHSIRAEYSPQGDAALEGAASLGAAPREFIGHTDYLQGVAFSPDGKWLATGSADMTARLWDLATTQEVRRFTGHTAKVESVAFSPDGKYVVTGSDDHTARLWDAATGQQVRLFSGHSAEIYYAAYSHDGKHVLTASQDGSARLWDAASGETVQTFNPNSGPILNVAFSPDDNAVLTGGLDNEVRLWDTATGRRIKVFSGHTQLISSVVFSPDGKYIASSSFDRTARLWEVGSGQQLRLFSGHDDGVNSVAFSPDGKYLLTGSNDRTLRLWDVASGLTVHLFAGNRHAINGAAYSPDGKYVAAGLGDSSVKVWSVQTSPGEMQFIGHTAAVMHASFSPDGKTVVTACADKTARLWDAATGKELLEFTGHKDAVNSAVFSPDGKTVVTTSYDGTARTWDASTGKSILTFANQGPNVVNRVAFSPDGKTVATSGDDKTVRIWDPLTGKELGVLRHPDHTTGVAFSPDGKYLLTGSFDGIARLWDAGSGKEVRRFAGHSGTLNGVAFSPDGKYVLTTGDDRTARLWDTQSGQEVRRFAGHGDIVRMGAFTSNGKYVITVSNDKTARLWYTDYHDTISYLCGLLTRDLTAEERAQYNITDQQPTCPAH